MSLSKKKALYFGVNVFSMEALTGDTIIMETGPPFYVVIWATQTSSRLQGKENCTFISKLF